MRPREDVEHREGFNRESPKDEASNRHHRQVFRPAPRDA